MRELLTRCDSLETVTVAWCPADDVVTLTVTRPLDDGAELVTAYIDNVPRDRVLDAFEHPYAYAAHCGSITLPERESIYISSEQDGDDEAAETFGGSATLNGEED